MQMAELLRIFRESVSMTVIEMHRNDNLPRYAVEKTSKKL